VIGNLRKKLLVCLLITALSALGAAAVGAEEAGNGRLTMQRAMEIALKEHPTLKESKEKVAAAQYQIGASRAAYLPQASFTSQVFYGNSFPGTTGTGASTSPAGLGNLGARNATDFYTNRFSFSQLIYDFGKTPGLIDQSRATYHQSREDYSGNRQQVVLDVRSAYFGYLAAIRARKVTEETVRQNQELVKQAQGFYDVGLRAKIDVTKAEANLYNVEADLIRAKNAVDLAKVTLMTALGMKTFPFEGLEDVLEITPIPHTLGELRAQALERRPEMVKNRYQDDFNQAALRVARAGWLPTLSSQASYGWSGPNAPIAKGAFDQDSWWFGAGVTVPLFDGLLAYHNMKVANANIRATNANKEVLTQNITKEVDQRFLDLTSAWELIRATKKALEAARENFRLAQGRYQVGVGSIIEVTDAQVEYFQTDLRYVRALYDYRVAEAQLDKAIGKPF
jgi:TolC family type I secretion outer membrane protein